MWILFWGQLWHVSAAVGLITEPGWATDMVRYVKLEATSINQSIKTLNRPC
jgi:hypothetical protein